MAAKAHGEAQARTDAREATRQTEAKAVETAVRRFGAMVELALAAYEPEITQADLNAVTWSRPDPSAALLTREIDRIIGVLEPLLQEAGFPLGTRDKALRKRMTRVWVEAQAALQGKAFGGLDLPRFYRALDGVLVYEPVSWRKDDLGDWGHFGDWSGHRYPRRPVLTP